MAASEIVSAVALAGLALCAGSLARSVLSAGHSRSSERERQPLLNGHGGKAEEARAETDAHDRRSRVFAALRALLSAALLALSIAVLVKRKRRRRDDALADATVLALAVREMVDRSSSSCQACALTASLASLVLRPRLRNVVARHCDVLAALALLPTFTQHVSGSRFCAVRVRAQLAPALCITSILADPTARPSTSAAPASAHQPRRAARPSPSVHRRRSRARRPARSTSMDASARRGRRAAARPGAVRDRLPALASDFLVA